MDKGHWPEDGGAFIPGHPAEKLEACRITELPENLSQVARPGVNTRIPFQSPHPWTATSGKQNRQRRSPVPSLEDRSRTTTPRLQRPGTSSSPGRLVLSKQKNCPGRRSKIVGSAHQGSRLGTGEDLACSRGQTPSIQVGVDFDRHSTLLSRYVEVCESGPHRKQVRHPSPPKQARTCPSPC